MSKLLFIGGASSSGKSTVCQELLQYFGVENRRIHNYILQIARKEGITDTSQVWDELAKRAIKLLSEDTLRDGPIACDVHLAVQPTLDTLYAQGKPFLEDLNEPYIRGLNNKAITALDPHTEVGLVLLEVPWDQVLERRVEEFEKHGKKPRSLDPSSVIKEIEFERRYFEETALNIRRYHPLKTKIVRNKNGEIPRAVNEIATLMRY